MREWCKQRNTRHRPCNAVPNTYSEISDTGAYTDWLWQMGSPTALADPVVSDSLRRGAEGPNGYGDNPQLPKYTTVTRQANQQVCTCLLELYGGDTT